MRSVLFVLIYAYELSGAMNFGSVSIQPQYGVTILSAHFAPIGQLALPWTSHLFPEHHANDEGQTTYCSFALYGISNILCARKNTSETIKLTRSFQHPIQRGSGTISIPHDRNQNTTIHCQYSTVYYGHNSLESCAKPIFYYCPILSSAICSQVTFQMSRNREVSLTTYIAHSRDSRSVSNSIAMGSGIMNTFQMNAINSPENGSHNSTAMNVPNEVTVCFPLSYSGNKFGSIRERKSDSEGSPFNEILHESVRHHLRLGMDVAIYDNWAAHEEVLLAHGLLSRQQHKIGLLHTTVPGGKRISSASRIGVLRYYERTLASAILESRKSEYRESEKNIPFKDMDKIFSVIHCSMEAHIRTKGRAEILVADPDEIFYCPGRSNTYEAQAKGLADVLLTHGRAKGEVGLLRCETIPRRASAFEDCMNTARVLKTNTSIFTCFAAFEYATCSGGKTLHMSHACPVLYLHRSCHGTCMCPRTSLHRDECVLLHLHASILPSHQFKTPPNYTAESPPLKPLELVDLTKSFL